MNNNYTLESAIDYYNKYFNGDFERYFKPVRNSDGQIVVPIQLTYSTRPTLRNIFSGKAAAAISHFQREQNMVSNNFENGIHQELPNGTKEDDFLFAAFVGFHVIAQCALNSTLIFDKRLYQFVKDNAFPVFIGENGYWASGSVMSILKDVRLYPYSTQEKHLFNDAMEIVFPWLKERFMRDVCSWNNGELSRENGHKVAIADQTKKEIEDSLYMIKRELAESETLSGYSVDKRFIMDYFHTQYFADMEKYFKVNRRADYPMILTLSYHDNRRLQDGDPAGSINGNFVFSAIFLWMILVVKSLWHIGGEEIAEAFHRSCGWPWISSGPGGGFEISSMLMLKEAGIAPTAEESLLFLKTMNEVFFVMNEIFNQILNGRGDLIEDKTANAELVRMIKGHGHKKQYIAKELEKETLLFKEELFRNIQGLLEQN